jgi:hypothetical protein
MGIINNDVYVSSSGVQKSDTYISFASETVYLTQNPTISNGTALYSVRANYRIYWDQAARESGKSFLDLLSVSTQVTRDQLGDNLYTQLYEVLKTIYPNHSDENRSIAPVAPSVSSSAPSAPSAPAAEPAPSSPSEPAAPAAEPTPSV